MKHINKAKSRINRLYNTLPECLIAIVAIRVSLDADIDNERDEQEAHVDFKGVKKRYLTCENGITREYQCGRGPTPICPGGNTY